MTLPNTGAHGLVVVVDDRYRPLFPAQHLTTFEEAERLLDGTPVRKLWLRVDPTSPLAADSLVDILVNEAPWEGRSQIDTIVIFYEPGHVLEAHELFARLTLFYTVELEPITSELFETIKPA